MRRQFSVGRKPDPRLCSDDSRTPVIALVAGGRIRNNPAAFGERETPAKRRGRSMTTTSQGGAAVSHPFVFRPDTQDEGVFHAVNTHNEYRLPQAFRADDVIIDIGMHIGSFCYAALTRGSNHVYG